MANFLVEMLITQRLGVTPQYRVDSNFFLGV